MRDSKRDTDVKNSLLGCFGGRRQGWHDLKGSVEMCILSYVKWITGPGSMHETGCSGLVHWDEPEGWDGERSGREFRMGNKYTPMADSCQCMAKTATIF